MPLLGQLVAQENLLSRDCLENRTYVPTYISCINLEAFKVLFSFTNAKKNYLDLFQFIMEG